VAHLLLDLDAAGAQIVCARLVSRLDRSRFAPQVIALQGPGVLQRWLTERTVPVHCLEAPEGVRPDVVLRLAALLRREHVQVLHCHNCKAMLYGGLAAASLPGVRVVMTKHGFTHWTTGPVAALGRLLMRRADAVTAVTSDIEHALSSGGWGRRERLLTVPNGVDTDEFQPSVNPHKLRSDLGFGPEDRLIGMVQRLSPEKDPLNLLQAFHRVADALPEARLLVVGEGPLQPEMERRATAGGMRDRVSFLGVRPDVPRVLGALDVFCLPSRTEGTSLSLLEAMACGLPVVATAVGGTPKVLAGEQAGLLVPPEDPEALAAALLRVLADPAAARRMSEAGRRLACERYGLSVSVERYARLYEQLLSGSAPAAA
jgi:glycosyltransferase involved in cell wall biosynthesis